MTICTGLTESPSELPLNLQSTLRPKLQQELQQKAKPLLHYIQQQWPALLARQRLDVALQLADRTSTIPCEIFVGDEFRLAGKLHVDVVIRPACTVTAMRPLPAILVFEKSAQRLVQHELNGFGLETPVLLAARC